MAAQSQKWVLTFWARRRILGTEVPEVHLVDSMDAQKQIHIKLDLTVHQALRLEAAICNLTIQDLVVELIRQRIAQGQFHGLLEGKR